MLLFNQKKACHIVSCMVRLGTGLSVVRNYAGVFGEFDGFGDNFSNAFPLLSLFISIVIVRLQ